MKATKGIVASSLVAAAMGVPSLALAEGTFQAEAGLSYSRLKSDSLRQDTAGAEATYFFDKLPTQPKDYPLEQAQFVERIGALSGTFGRITSDPGNTRTKASMWGVSSEYRKRDTAMIAGAGILSSYSGNQIDARLYQASIGAYVGKTTM